MVRKGGPNNSIHNWLDMACRGFSKKARKDYQKQQKSERDNRNRKHVIGDEYDEGFDRPNIPRPAANSIPGLIPPGFQPGLVRPSVARPVAAQDGGQAAVPPYATQDPQRHRPSQNSVQRPQSGPIPRHQSQREDERTETEIALAQLEDISPQRPAQRESHISSGQATEASAMPATEASHASTARVPTERAELFDNGRTYVEGMAHPSSYRGSLRSQRRPSRR
jgi:hypothetical protein